MSLMSLGRREAEDRLAEALGSGERTREMTYPRAQVGMRGPLRILGARGGRDANATAATYDASGPVHRALKSVTEHIPAEVVATYVAMLAVLAPHRTDRLDQIAIFGLMCAATPFVAWATVAVEMRAVHLDLPRAPNQWPWRRMMSALVAFVVWASVLPDSVMTIFSWFAPKMGCIALLLLSLIYATYDRVWIAPERRSRHLPPRPSR